MKSSKIDSDSEISKKSIQKDNWDWGKNVVQTKKLNVLSPSFLLMYPSKSYELWIY